jgi:hypothetical protein
MRSSGKDVLQYFEKILMKKEIGKNNAQFYLAWAAAVMEINADSHVALKVLQLVSTIAYLFLGISHDT